MMRAPEPTGASFSVTLNSLLTRVHRAWEHELRAALLTPGDSEAGTLMRESAERYLRGPYRVRLERELDALAELVDMLPPDVSASLLGDGVLLGLVVQETMAGRGADPVALQRMIPTLVRGMEHWFAEVEAAVGWMRQDTVPVSALRGMVGLLAAGGNGAAALSVTEDLHDIL